MLNINDLNIKCIFFIRYKKSGVILLGISVLNSDTIPRNPRRLKHRT